jgi:hypothetical protein
MFAVAFSFLGKFDVHFRVDVDKISMASSKKYDTFIALACG